MHGKTIADALEIGMRAILKDHDPIALIEHDILTRSAELEELRKLRAEMQVLDPAQLTMKQFTQDAAAIEKKRIALWEKEKTNLIRDIRRGDVNWNRILWDYQFASKSEAKVWIRQRNELENIINISGVKS